MMCTSKELSEIRLIDHNNPEDILICCAIGTIARDVKIRNSKKGNKWIKFEIKVDGLPHPQKTYIKSFGDQVELIYNSCLKGDYILVIGKPQADSYETKDGKILKELCIIPSQIKLLGRKENNNTLDEDNIQLLGFEDRENNNDK